MTNTTNSLELEATNAARTSIKHSILSFGERPKGKRNWAFPVMWALFSIELFLVLPYVPYASRDHSRFTIQDLHPILCMLWPLVCVIWIGNFGNVRWSRDQEKDRLENQLALEKVAFPKLPKWLQSSPFFGADISDPKVPLLFSFMIILINSGDANMIGFILMAVCGILTGIRAILHARLLSLPIEYLNAVGAFLALAALASPLHHKYSIALGIIAITSAAYLLFLHLKWNAIKVRTERMNNHV